MMKRYLPFLCVIAVLAFSACKKESITPLADPTRAFYPTSVGHFVSYDVDSTIWDDRTGIKSQHHYQMMYTLADTFRDNQHRLSYTLYVSVRTNDTDQYVNSDVYYITPTVNGLEVVMNNLRFQKLIFPIINGSAWNGNSQIATNDQDLSYYAGWKYTYSHLGETYNNGRVSYDNTVIVDEDDETQNNPDTQPTAYAYRTYAREIYGNNVGMIYREITHWTYDPSSVPVGSTPSRAGYTVVMRATGHN